MNKVKVGVFGGYRGYTMIDQLLKNPDAELVAVCDKYQPILDKVAKTAEEKGITVALYNNFEDFITHDMDAVVLANYANEHATFAVRCLEAGKHVMSECLPAETPAQAVALIEAVERTGKIYTYAENYCYMKAPLEMWKRYRAGDIGEVMYCEGEYVHDCSGAWHTITYGDPDHWRNRLHPHFYCTHSIGPVLTTTGLRPVKVTGFEVPLNDSEKQKSIGFCRAAGIEMITLENGAVCKSIHGPLKREPAFTSYVFFGKKGMMESKRTGKEEFNLYVESSDPDVYDRGDWERYTPKHSFSDRDADALAGHGGSDFFPTFFFIEKILGRPNGEWCIDVYTAVDMGMCGILAFRSALQGNVPMEVPNFRNPEERDAWRNDNACTNPDVAGDQLLPVSSHEMPVFGPEVYEKMQAKWLREQEGK